MNHTEYNIVKFKIDTAAKQNTLIIFQLPTGFEGLSSPVLLSQNVSSIVSEYIVHPSTFYITARKIEPLTKMITFPCKSKTSFRTS